LTPAHDEKPRARIAALAAPPLALFAPLALSQSAAPLPETPGVSAGAFMQMLLALALIVGILVLGAYLLRRLNGGRTFGNTGPLRIVGGLMISPRERIVLLEVGETWVVVGIVPGQIKTLHTMPKGEIPVASGSDGGFGQWLKQMTERRNESV
jgi:flagellar protein FliO/FliZ